MADIRDIFEAEEKRRAALTDEEREAEDRERSEAKERRAKALADPKFLAKVQADYSESLAKMARLGVSRRIDSVMKDVVGNTDLRDAILKGTDSTKTALDTLASGLARPLESMNVKPPIIPDVERIKSPFPDIQQALDESREHQKASVDIMRETHENQTEYNKGMLGALLELNHQIRGTSTRDIILLAVATVTLLVTVLGVVI